MASGGEDRWLGPEVRWSSHPKPWFRTALKKARGAGWWFRKLKGHTWGEVACMAPHIDGDRCYLPIFSTGEGGENVAHTLELMVRNCQHGVRGDRVAEAALMVEAAERLTSAAENLIERDKLRDDWAEAKIRVEELLDQANFSADEGASLLDEAIERDLEADRLELAEKEVEEAARILIETVDLTIPSDALAVVNYAEEASKQAKRQVGTLTQESPKRLLLGRLSVVKDRIAALRAALSDFRRPAAASE